MEKLYETTWGKIAICGLLFALTVAMALPESAWARDRALNGFEEPERQTGDPLDTNDAAGGDALREDIWLAGDGEVSFVLDGDFWSSGILLVTQYGGTSIYFDLIVLSLPTDLPEGPDAK